MNTEYIPYTYLIGWSTYDIWYYGSETAQKAKIANPINLWNKYFTSSETVSQLRITCGEPDVIQIRKTFNNRKNAIEWEKKVLRRLDIRSKPKWLNRNVGGAVIFTDDIIHKMSIKRKGLPATQYQLENLSKGWKSPDNLKGRIHITNGIDNKAIFPTENIPLEWHQGRSIKFTENGISKLRESMLGRTPHNKGIAMSQEMKEIISKTKSGVPNPSAIGNKNVINKIWITNDIDSRRINKNTTIPVGWKVGRRRWKQHNGS